MLVSKHELCLCKMRFEMRDCILTYRKLKDLEWLRSLSGGFGDDLEFEKEYQLCKEKVKMYKKKFDVTDAVLDWMSSREP